jgi:dTDP-4-dehydrorhamnose 3,5-epimerase
MNVIQTSLPGVLVLEPRVYEDPRGYFFESFSQRDFDAQVVPVLGHPVIFVQDNESMSSYGVVRGLHFQLPPFTQAKLVRCVRGTVLDVVVDLRRGSPTYGRHEAVEISGENHRQVFIDKGFAHGFAVLSETAVFQYKCDEFYHPEADCGIQLLDPSLGIDWRIPADRMLLSDKDRNRPCLSPSFAGLPLSFAGPSSSFAGPSSLLADPSSSPADPSSSFADSSSSFAGLTGESNPSAL